MEKDGSVEEGVGMGRVSADLGSWRPGFSKMLRMTLDRLTLGSFSVNEEMGSCFHLHLLNEAPQCFWDPDM